MSEVANVINRYAQKNVAEIEQQWDGSRIEGDAEISFDIVADTPELVVGEYRATGQKMWILEYGSGSRMDDSTDNPGLPAYQSSDLWNNERENTEIRTRQGAYLDLDRQPHMGSGIGGEHGLNAERMNHGQVSIAESPRHIVKETVKLSTARNLEMKQGIIDAVGDNIKASIRRVL